MSRRTVRIVSVLSMVFAAITQPANANASPLDGCDDGGPGESHCSVPGCSKTCDSGWYACCMLQGSGGGSDICFCVFET